MKAHNVGLKMMQEEAAKQKYPLTETFIRQLHHSLPCEDYTIYRRSPNGASSSYVIHTSTYKTRPNSIITLTGKRFEYASPEETPTLMSNLVAWYNVKEQKVSFHPIELAAAFTTTTFAYIFSRSVTDVLLTWAGYETINSM